MKETVLEAARRLVEAIGGQLRSRQVAALAEAVEARLEALEDAVASLERRARRAE